VAALRYALAQTSLVEGGDGDLPGPDRLHVPPAQVTNDPQIVRAAADRGTVAVPARGHEGLGEAVRRLVQLAADQGKGAPRVEGATLHRRLPLRARPVQRHIEPPQAFPVAPEARLRRPIQQREGRRIGQLGLCSRAEVRNDLGVAPGGGELLGLVDDE
jgi:hypothetical protein